MTWVDLAVFGFLLISGLLAFVRGLVREVLGIGAWVGSLAIAFFSLPTMRGFVRSWIPQPEWVDPASFIVVFIMALIARWGWYSVWQGVQRWSSSPILLVRWFFRSNVGPTPSSMRAH
jgi:hypothetical protein